jgi:hypothetical protein
MDGNQWLATWILAVGVALAGWAFWDSRKTRDGELLTDLSRRWDETATVDSMRAYSTGGGPSRIIDLAKKLYEASEDDPPAAEGDLREFDTLNRWPSLIETIGVLRSQGAITTKAVHKMWGPAIIAAWEAWEAPVKTLRALDGYPSSTFPYFEKLAKKMQKRENRWWRKMRR